MIVACTLYKYGEKYMVYHKSIGDDFSPVCDLLLKLKSVYAENQLDKIDGLYTMSFDHIGKSTTCFSGCPHLEGRVVIERAFTT